MTWKAKEKSIYDNLKRKFAFVPVKVDDEWVWLEHYYVFRTWNIFGCYEVEYRWKTREEAEYDLSEAMNENAN